MALGSAHKLQIHCVNNTLFFPQTVNFFRRALVKLVLFAVQIVHAKKMGQFSTPLVSRRVKLVLFAVQIVHAKKNGTVFNTSSVKTS